MIDGNKRIAFAASYTFLAINGSRVTAKAEAIYTFIMELYDTHGFKYDSLVAWLRLHVEMAAS